jgi:hypothetical protein
MVELFERKKKRKEKKRIGLMAIVFLFDKSESS